MKFELKYELMLLKNYFDTGISLTSYPIKVMLVVGIGVAVDNVANLPLIILFSILYGVFCFILGWAFYKYKWINAQHEVTNRYNEFMKELRNNKVLKGK